MPLLLVLLLLLWLFLLLLLNLNCLLKLLLLLPLVAGQLQFIVRAPLYSIALQGRRTPVTVSPQTPAWNLAPAPVLSPNHIMTQAPVFFLLVF